jgi:hypothetical protein
MNSSLKRLEKKIKYNQIRLTQLTTSIHMKSQILAIAAALCLPTLSGAATLFFDSTVLGDSNGNALTSGIVRFGVFLPGTDFTQSISELADEFIQVGTYTISSDPFFGDLTYNGLNAATYSSGDGLTTLQFDTSLLNNANNAGDIAGSAIYAWVLNNASNLLVTEHGIFESEAFGTTWTDAQSPGSTDSGFSFDISSGDGFNALIGTASADIGTTRHTLAAIPEPSRALLGLIGLTGVMFRRRRAAKA